MERQIGEAAGKVWQVLSRNPLALGQLPKVTGLPVDLANQALGWLAREGKVVAQDTPKGTVLKIKN
ncbi:MAG TPA: winged helix-turn-helix domain-containing protein [Planctomycetota bacterium]|nr:winged helix-turn-helix domain-containing protein [Planctomycetota bacterium]